MKRPVLARWAQHVRSLLLADGKSQQQLAAFLGAKPTAVSKFFRQATPWPSYMDGVARFLKRPRLEVFPPALLVEAAPAVNANRVADTAAVSQTEQDASADPAKPAQVGRTQDGTDVVSTPERTGLSSSDRAQAQAGADPREDISVDRTRALLHGLIDQLPPNSLDAALDWALRFLAEARMDEKRRSGLQ